MKRVVVLGAGMVGTAIAMDLAKTCDVTVVDARDDALDRVAKRASVKTKRVDLSSATGIAVAVADSDLVMGALSSKIGLQTLRAVIEAKKNYVDISFMADDALALDSLAKANGVTCVVDCGVAPGMSNLLVGYAINELSPCERIDIFVGGLPAVRTWPYEYKAGFAPSDVIEEYVRPARFVVDGKVVVKEALSEPELLEFDGVGTLEAFNTDGLRSLTKLSVPNMSEKTLRYPGHIALMRVLRETGFFSVTPVRVNGVDVRPLDVTSAVLFPKWTFAPGEADVTVLRVTASGGGKTMRWDMLDRYDATTDLRSMSRTTAYPATAFARLILDGTVATPGVHAPEAFGSKKVVDAVLRDLEARGVKFVASVR